MAIIERIIDIVQPTRTVYDQWTQFEKFPTFMNGIEEVRQLDDTRMYRRASNAGRTVDWDAVITDQMPDQQVAWRSIRGVEHSGIVRVAPIDPGRTRVTVTITYDPMRVVRSIGSAPDGEASVQEGQNAVASEVQDDLASFKRFTEERGTATGSWRGEVQEGSIESALSGS